MRKFLAFVVVAVVAVLALHFPRATAATRFDYFTGSIGCEGNLNVDLHNMATTPVSHQVTFVLNDGTVLPAASANETGSIDGRKQREVQYACGAGTSGAIQIRTNSKLLMPSLRFTLAGGGPITFVPAGAWRLVVRK